MVQEKHILIDMIRILNLKEMQHGMMSMLHSQMQNI